MEYPKVTVITATYNLIRAGRAETIVQAIESVQSQKYEGEVEHLIMDGASDDGTLDLLSPFSRKGWIKVVSEKDNGLYDAMNKGITIATGKYTVFLNSDDYWSSELAVQKSVESLERTQADFSYGLYRVEKNGKMGKVDDPSLGIFFLRMPFGHQTMFTRTEVLKEFGGFNTKKYKSAADYDLILNIILSGKRSVYVDLDFVVFRAGGFSSDTQLNQSEVIDSMYSTYSKLSNATKEDCTNFFYNCCCPASLYQILKEKVSHEISIHMEKRFATSKRIGKLYYYKDKFINKDFFWSYIMYKIRSFLCVSKKHSIRKMTAEKLKIKHLNIKQCFVFGICIYKKYYDEGIRSYHIFNIPIITVIDPIESKIHK